MFSALGLEADVSHTKHRESKQMPFNFTDTTLMVFRIKGFSLEVDEFCGNATGFVCKRNNKYYLVTNKHVVTGKNPATNKFISGSTIPGRISFNLRKNSNPSLPTQNSSPFPVSKLRLYDDEYDLKTKQWLEHPTDPKIDVVALDITTIIAPEQTPYESIMCFDLENFKSHTDLAVMDQVFIVGYPLDPKLYPEHFPIYKSATIATEPFLRFGSPYFLVDGKTKSGMSGSPVLRQERDIVRVDGLKLTHITDRRNFLGIYSGRDVNDEELTTAELGIVWPCEECLLPILDQ
ncbi:trypsin-like peptidase domain-containing protein [Hellea sp.]|nr:trypsin-like peptidase domain-containing protein [Hellea sp.]